MQYIDKIVPLKVEPGIQMDGTDFGSANWTRGYWTRFNNRGTPQKIGGFKVITNLLPKIPRGITVVPVYPNFRAFLGFSDKLYYQDFDSNGNAVGGLVDRTPIGLLDNPNREWDFDILYNRDGAGSIQIIAHAPPNLQGIASPDETEVYYGDLNAVTPLVSIGALAVSGGVTVSGPFLFYFGNNGQISWSEENDPTAEAGDDFITGNKIIYGLPVRGGEAAPATLFWSLDCLIKATFSPDPDTGNPDFTFDSITCESSVLSSRGIIEYDSTYFWAATDRFLFYNGIVRELPNDMCLDYFFSNINMAQRQKVFVTKVTRWGEIWWFYPKIGSLECNAAVIYNIRLNKWYSPDSKGEMPEPPDVPYRFVGRSCGEYEQTFAYPVWAANTPRDGALTYDLYMQEFGVDIAKTGDPLVPIPALIVSNFISIPLTDNVDKEILIYRMDLDLIQSNPMDIIFYKTGYPRSDEISDSYTFASDERKIDFREQARNVRIGFLAPMDMTGGNFQLGKIMLAIRVADQRPLGTAV